MTIKNVIFYWVWLVAELMLVRTGVMCVNMPHCTGTKSVCPRTGIGAGSKFKTMVETL